MEEKHLLRGRQRRYFGYMSDIAHKVDTPESAKSYRSVISPITRKIKSKYEPLKSFKPDPPGQPRFADKILHRTIKTHIPGLLPALKNSPQFDEHDETLKINLRSPEFEQHKQRSLHYFWLPRNERTELCGIFQHHLKPSEKRKGKLFAPGGKRTQLSGMAAEAAVLDQQEYLENIANDPRFASNKTRALNRRGPSETPSRIFRMNRKYQMSYWDPTYNKHLQDPYRRVRSKLPACDAICHEHFETFPEHRDILTCLGEYKKRYEEVQDLSGEPILLSDKREKLRRLSLFGNLQDEEKRRGFKHIKELKEYDKESEALWTKQAKLMISAGEYINKIKNGRRFPTPPRELRKKEKKHRNQSDAMSTKSEVSSVNVEEYLHNNGGVSGAGRPNHHKQKWKKHRHFHHNYNSEDFYMEMYLHFLNPEEDVSLKAPPHQMTDVRELRRKMNLDEDEEKEKKLMNMLHESSLEALNIQQDHERRSVQSHSLTSEEILHEKEILEHQISRLKNPRLVHILTRMLSQINIQSDSITMTSSESKKSPLEIDSADDEQKTSQPATMTDWTLLQPSSAGKVPATLDQIPEFNDDDLDKIGDIPEHELRMIMSEIAVSSKGSASTDNLSSGSSGGEEEENEGEGEDENDDALKLFKKARRKKDSVAEFMDLTTEFRARVCQREAGKPPGLMNPFAEAVCILYPEGSEKKSNKAKKSRLLGSGSKTVIN